MIHFVPDSFDAVEPVPTPYAEAVTRLASLRQALSIVEGQPAANDDDARVACTWAEAGEAQRAHFDDHSARTVSGAAAGLEAVAMLRADGLDANPAATEALARDIRARLDELGVLFSL